MFCPSLCTGHNPDLLIKREGFVSTRTKKRITSEGKSAQEGVSCFLSEDSWFALQASAEKVRRASEPQRVHLVCHHRSLFTV